MLPNGERSIFSKKGQIRCNFDRIEWDDPKCTNANTRKVGAAGQNCISAVFPSDYYDRNKKNDVGKAKLLTLMKMYG